MKRERPWTKAEDAAIRRRYPASGPAMCAQIGRSPSATQRRASTLGVRAVRKARPPRVVHGEAITEEILRWAHRKAGAYARRFGDSADRFGSCVPAALAVAWRKYDPSRGVSFAAWTRRVVISKLKLESLRGGVAGYRRTGSSPRRAGEPAIYSLGPGDGDTPSPQGPVGWEVEYEDFVSAIARTLPGSQGDVVRMVYLECAGATIGNAARALGLSHSRASEIHSAAIASLRATMGREGRAS